jgi:RND family efflux transporter MFP subunit
MLSPVDGFITTRNISLGQRFERGTELFRIADLSTVWIVADAYDRDARYIRPRVAAHVVQTGMGKVMHGSVSTVPPQFDPATRTLKFRIDVQNPSLELRPDMFVNVDLEVDTPSRLSVPVDAVLDSGTQQRIFVARGDGHFESRTVRVGARTGDQVEITDGLRVGEEIVVSANFLLDSASRMRAVSARADTGTSSKDLICGMDVSAEKAQKDGLVSTYRGTTYYFCSRGCKTKFDAAPEKYVPRSSVASLSTTAGNTNPQ